jgi:DNA-binding transcriptional MerR regulator
MPTQESFGLQELAQRSGVPPRTIRYYVSRGLLPGPRKGGRNACYGPEHLERLETIVRWQREGLSLAEIQARLGAASNGREAVVNPRPWWAYALADDVVVNIRADAPPWRLHQLKTWLATCAELLPRSPSHSEAVPHDEDSDA